MKERLVAVHLFRNSLNGTLVEVLNELQQVLEKAVRDGVDLSKTRVYADYDGEYIVDYLRTETNEETKIRETKTAEEQEWLRLRKIDLGIQEAKIKENEAKVLVEMKKNYPGPIGK